MCLEKGQALLNGCNTRFLDRVSGTPKMTGNR